MGFIDQTLQKQDLVVWRYGRVLGSVEGGVSPCAISFRDGCLLPQVISLIIRENLWLAQLFIFLLTSALTIYPNIYFTNTI